MHSKNEVELSFDARSVNEGFARMAVAAFITELNPTMDELLGCQDGRVGGGDQCKSFTGMTIRRKRYI